MQNHRPSRSPDGDCKQKDIGSVEGDPPMGIYKGFSGVTLHLLAKLMNSWFWRALTQTSRMFRARTYPSQGETRGR
jgi:hypothetical protein